MDVKEAVNKATAAAGDLFGPEMLNNLQLEEVDFDEQAGTWQITLGFDVPDTNPLKSIGKNQDTHDPNLNSKCPLLADSGHESKASGATQTKFHRCPSISSNPWSYIKP